MRCAGVVMMRGRSARGDDARGMGVERHRDGAPVVFAGDRNGPADQFAVSGVDAIEVADGDASRH